MPMTLYCMDGSPPVRSVYLCLEALGLKPERKILNLLNKAHLSPEYVKINPQHSIPTLDDDGFIIWDSHAINAYLVGKYAKDDSLYPKDLKKRAVVDQRLHFDTGVLFPSVRDIVFPLIFLKSKEIKEEQRKKVTQAYDFLEKFLEGHDWVAGDHYTIADMSCVSAVATLVDALRCPVDNHPRIKAWLQRCKDTLPGYKAAMDRGLFLLKGMVDAELG